MRPFWWAPGAKLLSGVSISDIFSSLMPNKISRHVHRAYRSDVVLDVCQISSHWENGTQNFDLACNLDVSPSLVSSRIAELFPQRWIVATVDISLSLRRLIQIFILIPAEKKEIPEVFVTELAQPISIAKAMLYFTIVRGPLFNQMIVMTDTIVGMAHRFDRCLAVLGHMGQKLGNRFGTYSDGARHCRYSRC
jgi:hypothetical protein